jgi:hypothetical protein
VHRLSQLRRIKEKCLIKGGCIQHQVLFKFSFFLVFLRFSAEVLPIVHTLTHLHGRPSTLKTLNASTLMLFLTFVSTDSYPSEPPPVMHPDLTRDYSTVP